MSPPLSFAFLSGQGQTYESQLIKTRLARQLRQEGEFVSFQVLGDWEGQSMDVSGLSPPRHVTATLSAPPRGRWGLVTSDQFWLVSWEWKSWEQKQCVPLRVLLAAAEGRPTRDFSTSGLAFATFQEVTGPQSESVTEPQP
jgi:hypothetical protein